MNTNNVSNNELSINSNEILNDSTNIEFKQIEITLKKMNLEEKRLEVETKRLYIEGKRVEIESKRMDEKIREFELIQREAHLLSKMSFTPENFRGKIPECVAILQFSRRLNMDPMVVMNQIHIIHGKITYSAALMIAIINKCGDFTQLEFLYSGEGDKRSCIAKATSLSTNTLLKSVMVSIAMAREEGWIRGKSSKWITMPDLMLQYRAAAFFCRAYAAHYLIGHIKEEIEDISIA